MYVCVCVCVCVCGVCESRTDLYGQRIPYERKEIGSILCTYIIVVRKGMEFSPESTPVLGPCRSAAGQSAVRTDGQSA
uniref:Putative secreted protein n=1 Tax=Anopheles marajoara TaxID=58244 RepID=A0A2M4CC93_9DIPT